MHKHVHALVEAGLVHTLDGRRRGVRLRRAGQGTATLPLLGRIAAGRPIEAVPREDSLEVPASMLTAAHCFVLEVIGDSMVEAGILDGDRVVVEPREHASDGDIVVALIGGQETTLKRLYRRRDQVELLPANSALPPLVLAPDDVRIQGVVTGLIRRYV